MNQHPIALLGGDASAAPASWRDDARSAAALAAIRSQSPEASRPLLLAGGTVISMDPSMGDWAQADVLIGGSVIVGVGPGLLTAAGDDNMIVIDCEGALVLPARIDFFAPHRSSALTPGQVADIAVVRHADPHGTPQGAVPARGQHLDILISAGAVAIWDGKPLVISDPTEVLASAPASASSHVRVDPTRVGLWVDENNFLRQELLANGRYDEARGDRESAYQGRYWIDGDRITYLDDLGFWAFGDFKDNQLLHAGYRMQRL